MAMTSPAPAGDRLILPAGVVNGFGAAPGSLPVGLSHAAPSGQHPLFRKYGLTTPSDGYTMGEYAVFRQYWQKQREVDWHPWEIQLSEDRKDWEGRLIDKERNLLTQVFRLFTQSDMEVSDNYMTRFAQVFKPVAVQMMLIQFAAMETVHIEAYSMILQTNGMPESEFTAFREYVEMRDKVDYMAQFGVKNEADVARTLAMFGGATEGVMLFSSFAMILNFPRHNKMRRVGQIVAYSMRDESLHCEGISEIFKMWIRQTGCLTKAVRDDILEVFRHVIDLEDRFIDLAFEAGAVEGMTPQDVKAYIRLVADWRLEQFGLPKMFGVKEHPMPWIQEITSGVEFTNFFENNVTEYSSNATKGTWEDAFGKALG